MRKTITNSQSLAQENIILISLAAFLFFFHLFANAFTSYGIFRDEFYYLACTRHLAWGYVDHPPLSIFLLVLNRWLLGDALFALRLLPALAMALTVVFTGLMVRQMKGGSLAILIACLAVVLAPIFLAMGTYYSMNSFDILLWSVAAYLLLRIIRRPKPVYWISLGVVMGLGLLNKIGFLWFGAGLFFALLLTPLRSQLLTPWPYLAGILAFAIFSPFILWNVQHDFAHVAFMQNAVAYKYNSLSRVDFVLGQLLLPNPAALPVWLAGLYFFFFHPAGKTYRPLGIVFLTAFLILLINGHSKPEYLSAAYPMVFAGGAVLLAQMGRKWRWVTYVIIAGLAFTLALTPLTVPLLPVRTYIAYADALGISAPNTEGKAMAELPQFYADMFGWEALAQHVSAVYQSLPEAERAHTLVYTQNYGEAGALEYYSKSYLLPQIISGHNNYWLWGYGDHEWQTLIVVGGDREDHLQSFEQVEEVAIHQAPYAMPYENNLPVFVCRKIKRSTEEIWQDTKKFI